MLELVEGPTLAEHIARRAGSSGPAGLPIEETLPMARQIADALEAAHEHGIVHRDLKPANVKLRDDGTVKVLDFGLTKLTEAGGAGEAGGMGAVSQSPTLSVAATRLGVILGTASYMSPEQAQGRVVDTRTDIWAFGCVLYEMLTGRRAFDGEDVTDVPSRVLQREPDFTALPPTTPRAVRRLLARCLQKDPRARLRDIGDAKAELDQPADDGAHEVVAGRTIPRSQRRLVAGLAGARLLVTVALAWLVCRADSVPDPVSRRLSIALPPGVELGAGGNYGNPLVFSPDGSTLVLRISASNASNVVPQSCAPCGANASPATQRLRQ